MPRAARAAQLLPVVLSAAVMASSQILIPIPGLSLSRDKITEEWAARVAWAAQKAQAEKPEQEERAAPAVQRVQFM